MKLVIFGATRGTGKQVMEQALQAGHDVTVVVRRPVEIMHERLNIVRGDVMKLSEFERAMAGQDVVVSSLGVANREPTNLYSQGITNIINAMRDAKIHRLICLSASGFDPGPLWQRVIARPLLNFAFKYGYDDMKRMENIVRESGLDWTIIRPPRLTDGARTGSYQIAVNRHLTSGWKISRADLADYIVKHLDDPAISCGQVEIAY